VAVAQLFLVRSYTCDTESLAFDMFGRCSGEPPFLDAQFVVGRPAPVLLHAEVCQSDGLAVDHGCPCRHSRNSIRFGIAAASVLWPHINHIVFGKFSRRHNTLLLQFMASPHTKDLTNRWSQPLAAVLKS
jgi:hypothetical protein